MELSDYLRDAIEELEQKKMKEGMTYTEQRVYEILTEAYKQNGTKRKTNDKRNV